MSTTTRRTPSQSQSSGQDQQQEEHAEEHAEEHEEEDPRRRRLPNETCALFLERLHQLADEDAARFLAEHPDFRPFPSREDIKPGDDEAYAQSMDALDAAWRREEEAQSAKKATKAKRDASA